MSPLGTDVGKVDIPQCSERVGDDLILDPPDCRVPLTLFKFAALSLHRLWTAYPVVVELSQGRVHMVSLAWSQTGECVVVLNCLGPLSAVE